MSTFERIDLSEFPHGGMYDELRRAYAEIDRLRASALEWVTVTGDPATLPTATRVVMLKIGVSTYRIAERMYGGRLMKMHGGGARYLLESGDRWTYIPEVQA